MLTLFSSVDSLSECLMMTDGNVLCPRLIYVYPVASLERVVEDVNQRDNI